MQYLRVIILKELTRLSFVESPESKRVDESLIVFAMTYLDKLRINLKISRIEANCQTLKLIHAGGLKRKLALLEIC